MRILFVAILAFSFVPAITVSDAVAQATCRNKCTEQEQSCLQRTGNKSQCGAKAQQCIMKCK